MQRTRVLCLGVDRDRQPVAARAPPNLLIRTTRNQWGGCVMETDGADLDPCKFSGLPVTIENVDDVQVTFAARSVIRRT
jgi:hypothetical protein